ncbi:hypothetical protein [Haliangium sp.]|uniref:hypothetical protein n=1 Tax=Haliangium sp. TaxID=2663208 RepID=UPI003D0AAADD
MWPTRSLHERAHSGALRDPVGAGFGVNVHVRFDVPHPALFSAIIATLRLVS